MFVSDNNSKCRYCRRIRLFRARPAKGKDIQSRPQLCEKKEGKSKSNTADINERQKLAPLESLPYILSVPQQSKSIHVSPIQPNVRPLAAFNRHQKLTSFLPSLLISLSSPPSGEQPKLQLICLVPLPYAVAPHELPSLSQISPA